MEQQARFIKFFDGMSSTEDLNDITEKLVLDLEIFNGFAVAITWSKLGTIAKMEHVPFEKIRVDKEEKMFQVADWYNDDMMQLFPKIEDIEKIPDSDTHCFTHRNSFNRSTSLYTVTNQHRNIANTHTYSN